MIKMDQKNARISWLEIHTYDEHKQNKSNTNWTLTSKYSVGYLQIQQVRSNINIHLDIHSLFWPPDECQSNILSF